MLAKCTASQWVITVAPKSLAYQYDVDIVFGRPEAIDDDNAKGVKKLTKSNDDFHKRLCRHILESLEALDGITHSYDERAIMWTNKPLKQDINLTVAQPHLDKFLQESLKDSEAVLRILVSKTRTIDLSDLLFTSVRTNPAEDRTCRTVTEMILSESPITRKDNPYVSIGAGQLFETSSEYFDRGLIYRDGNKKGVQVVKGSSNNPQLWLSLDFCRKVFFPDNVKFIDLVQSFMASANMSNGHGDFPLELLEVLPNQPVPIVRMPETLKEKALELNRLKPHERFALIQKQFKKLALNNSVTTAFGININSQMIVGDFQRFQRMRIILDRATVESNDQGSFKFDRNMYYNAAGFAKLVVFATRRDYQKSMECANAIVQAALNKGMQMPKPSFKEFDTYSKHLNEWIKAMNEFKGIKTVALIIDNNKESHPIVKLAEALTGVQTQHLFFDTAFKVARGRPQTLENIVHKLNVKAGGINHLVDFGPNLQKLKLAETLIIALDVSHPTGDDYKGSTDEPSIGGLTGNYLANPNEFAGLFFFQSPRQEAVDQTSLKIYVKKMLQQAQKCGRS
uniref:Piwi domain-containing protein n=1 Tax=Panagrolaimus sp. ES5 TaxID=591445 RepID=A0AC34F1N3_9BILA